MQIESKILEVINGSLKNPIYKTIQQLNIKTILKQSNFKKKDGVSASLIVLHFVYMLVMNKKTACFYKSGK